MKQFVMCMAVVFAMAMSVHAQDTAAQAGSEKAPKGGHAAVKGPQKSAGAVEGDQDRRSVTGCVEKSGDGYMLKNAHYKDGFMLHGKDVRDDELAAHVGHTVTLSGTWATPKKDFNVDKVKMVADNCNAKVETAAGKHKGKTAGETATPPQK